MNTTFFSADTLVVEQNEAIAADVLIKLDDLALALVGGGMGNVDIG